MTKETVPVSQADIDAMNSILWVETLIDDKEAILQAFARHRLAENEACEARLARATLALMEFDIHRYLIANVRASGAEKAERHKNLVDFFLRVYAPKWAQRDREIYTLIHDATQPLTNNLDRIGLGSDCHYLDSVVTKFHDQFVSLASNALAQAIAARRETNDEG